MSKIKINKSFILNSVKQALKEDLYPLGDITSSLVNNKKNIKSKIISNQASILGGLEFARQAFRLIDKKIKFTIKKKEGSSVKKGEIIALVTGNVKKILTAERVALNFMSHISGIATQTNQFVKLTKGTKCKVCCTRKTIPNLRLIQKYGVKLGGGTNHRFNLSDEYLIKDNHIASKDIKYLVNLAVKNKKNKKITVEVDNLMQLKKIIGLKFNRILFDNMSLKQMRLGVRIANENYETEASGNINIDNIKKIAATGVDRVSVGRLTHSVNAVDFKLEI